MKDLLVGQMGELAILALNPKQTRLCCWKERRKLPNFGSEPSFRQP